MKSVSIIVPTLNESENIVELVRRVVAAFKGSSITYELLFIDDRSTDDTCEIIEKLARKYPIRLHVKTGQRGKAFSLLEGFELAKYDTICMIDADLQYPPEAIVPMYNLMQNSNAAIVLTERIYHDASAVRKVVTKGFNIAFTRVLFGINYDSQSGLKLFKREVAQSATLSPTPWSFDMEFIVRALENNYRIVSYKIPFSKRFGGEAKVRIVRVSYELARASIKLRFNSNPIKIRRAYRMNLKQRSQAVNGFVLPLLIAGGTLLYTLAMPVPASAQAVVTPVGSVSSSLPQIQVVRPPVTNILLQPSGQSPAPNMQNPIMSVITTDRSGLQTGNAITGTSISNDKSARTADKSPSSSSTAVQSTAPVSAGSAQTQINQQKSDSKKPIYISNAGNSVYYNNGSNLDNYTAEFIRAVVGVIIAIGLVAFIAYRRVNEASPEAISAGDNR